MTLDMLAEEIRAHALCLPEAHEDHPWGECAFKVRKKVFVFMGRGEADLGVSVKLPVSAERALTRPGAAPTGYGLGKSGWVSGRVPEGQPVDLDELRAWIEESYRAVAPKRLGANL